MAIVAGLVFGALGYWLSELDRRRFGRTPWGLPSGLWAFFWFLSIVLGLVLYVIAHLDVARRARQFPGGRFPSPSPSPGATSPGPFGLGVAAPPPPTATDFPSYPRPANEPAGGPPDISPPTPELGAAVPTGEAGQLFEPTRGADRWPETAEADETAEAAAPTAPLPAAAGWQPAAVSPPEWHPDPSGRFHYRWWDGSQWTSYVSFNGQQLIDTSPDQRIGPYG